MSELGELVSTADGKKIHIPDWYEYERRKVREEIELGTYHFSSTAAVDSLPNAKGYLRLGEALLTHDMNGFRLEGELLGKSFLLEKHPSSMYSCHIEYEYMGKGDCIDLSTLEDTYYIYPKTEEWSATKISLATEELYNYRAAEKQSVSGS
jgi:hypothetical protein